MTNNTLIPPAVTLALGLAFALAPSFAPEFRGYAPSAFPVEIARHAVQPAGYAFAIWGVIFLWLLASASFGLLRRAGQAAWARPRLALNGAMVLGSVWLFLAAAQPLAATAVILAMAACAIAAFLRTDMQVDRWILGAPIAIFAGWVSAASVVSVGIILGGYGVLSSPAAALVMVAVLLVGALIIQARQPMMPLYGAAIVWAMMGVAGANNAALPGVGAGAVGAALILAGGTIWLRLRARSRA